MYVYTSPMKQVMILMYCKHVLMKNKLKRKEIGWFSGARVQSADEKQEAKLEGGFGDRDHKIKLGKYTKAR